MQMHGPVAGAVEKLCREGRLRDALCQVERGGGETPPRHAYVCLLRACGSRKALAQGKLVHALVLRNERRRPDVLVANHLIGMYSKCGSTAGARAAFDAIPRRDTVSWTSMISAYAGAAMYGTALCLFDEMRRCGAVPDRVALVVALKACARVAALPEGEHVHSLVLEGGFERDVVLRNLLIDMYAKCGCVERARGLFDGAGERNVVSWTAMISGYALNGHGEEALVLYKRMKQEGVRANKVTLVCVLKACAQAGALEQGKLIHSLLLGEGLKSDVVVQSALVDMYAKCGRPKDARELFGRMSKRSVVSWNAMIAGYVQNGFSEEALALYEQMKLEGVQPNKITLLCALKACASTGALGQGKLIHSLVMGKGFDLDVTVQNTLLDMYAKCECLKDAHELFNSMAERSVVSWNAMIAGFVQNGLGKEALALYDRMKLEGIQANETTCVSLLKACADIRALEQGKVIHSLILDKGFGLDVIVQSSLVDMYAKCGCLEDAHELFNNMNQKNVVSWTALIAGYAQNGLGKEALALYEQMKQEGMQANKATFICVLKACAIVGALEQGKQIHSLILEEGFDSDVMVQNTLIDMYVKCGCLVDARELFNSTSKQNVASWNAMIAGYAQNGLGTEALALYEQMKQEGLQPDDVTYVCVLSACNHSGLIEEGICVFDFMYKHSFVILNSKHYACMIDLLGRVGLLAEAEDLITKMPIQPDSVVWTSLLATARNAGNAEIGQHAINYAMKLEPENATPYLLPTDI